jgi:hypothetical protein
MFVLLGLMISHEIVLGVNLVLGQLSRDPVIS